MSSRSGRALASGAEAGAFAVERSPRARTASSRPRSATKRCFRIESPACRFGNRDTAGPRPYRLSVRPRMGKAGIREYGAHDQGEPTEPHRNDPATDRSLPPEDDPQQMDQTDHGKDDRCYVKVALAIHPLGLS